MVLRVQQAEVDSVEQQPVDEAEHHKVKSVYDSEVPLLVRLEQGKRNGRQEENEANSLTPKMKRKRAVNSANGYYDSQHKIPPCYIPTVKFTI